MQLIMIIITIIQLLINSAASESTSYLNIVNDEGEILNESAVGPFEPGSNLNLSCLTDGNSTLKWYQMALDTGQIIDLNSSINIDNQFDTKYRLQLKNLSSTVSSWRYYCQSSIFKKTWVQIVVNLSFRIRLIKSADPDDFNNVRNSNDSTIIIKANRLYQFECYATDLDDGQYELSRLQCSSRMNDGQEIELIHSINGSRFEFESKIGEFGDLFQLICWIDYYTDIDRRLLQKSTVIQSIAVHYSNITLESADNNNLICRIQSNPPIRTVQWYIDGKLLLKTRSFKPVGHNMIESSLNLTNFNQKLLENGQKTIRFRCEGRNLNGQTLTSADLIIDKYDDDQSNDGHIDNYYHYQLFIAFVIIVTMINLMIVAITVILIRYYGLNFCPKHRFNMAQYILSFKHRTQGKNDQNPPTNRANMSACITELAQRLSSINNDRQKQSITTTLLYETSI